MKPKIIGKITVDIGMTVLLLLLMAFELVERTAHEWIGAGMFVLFIVHHILNRKWTGNLLRGRYSPYRILQTVSAFLVFAAMLGAVVSAVLISREVFAFFSISGGRSFGRSLHMLSAYWGFVFLAFHLGIHWNSMMGMAGRLWKEKSKVRTLFLRLAGTAIAVYGVYAMIRRDIFRYMFLQSQFVFFDFEEPLIFFFLDYLAVMGLFVFAGHYTAAGVRRIGKGNRRKTA